MTNSNYTHLAVVVDRSGSMWSIQEDMRGALNELFKAQAELPGTCLVDYVQFDNEIETVFENRGVSKAEAVLEPRGSTSLLDAIGKTVTNLGKKLANLPEELRPGTVIVAIVTDGGENSSREWKSDAVKELVERQQSEWNWEFLFLGANMDAVETAAGFGIGAQSALTYDTSNTGAAVAAASGYIATTRTGLTASFTDEDRQNAL